jgi:hypothetical protein
MKYISKKKLAIIALLGISLFICLDIYSDITDVYTIYGSNAQINDDAIYDGDDSNHRINYIFLFHQNILINVFSSIDSQFAKHPNCLLDDISHIFYERYYKYIVYSKGSFV